MSKYYLVVTAPGEAPALTSFLKFGQAEVSTLVIGSKALAEEASAVSGEVKWIDTANTPAENFVSAAADVVVSAAPDAVIGVASPATRAVIGKSSVAFGTPVVPNLLSVCADGGKVSIEYSVLGDKMIESAELPLHAGLLVNPFSLPLLDAELIPAEEKIEIITAQSEATVEYISLEPAVASSLQKADLIVGIGLGASSPELFEQARKLAALMGAEVGCSMPVYNELALLPHEAYVGITGTKVAPNLYLALGISDTSQHCAGVRNAKTIVCVNKDPNALFFHNADYGIVSDLNEVLPALIAAFSK